jgi:hypothetical protein
LGLFNDNEADEFARRLAKELQTRVPAASLKGTATEEGAVRLLRHVAAKGRDYSKGHKVGVLKQIGLSRTFQAELSLLGYDEEVIKEATLELARAMREK